MFFEEFLVTRPKIAMISDFGIQIEKRWLVLEGLAGEAACRGRERVGMLGFITPHLPPLPPTPMRTRVSEFCIVC